MVIEKKGKNLILSDVSDFNLAQTMECGQCFHFVRLDEDPDDKYSEYEISAYGKYLHIAQENDKFIFFDTSKKDFNDIWKNYFDLDRDYGKIKRYIAKRSPELKDIIKQNRGIRILNQEFFETMMSFIISQNNRIPRIKGIVAAISRKWGRMLTDTMYAFPTPDEFCSACEDDFKDLKTGFRAGYLCDAINKQKSTPGFEKLLRESDISKCSELLCTVKGIGPKVANCIMLFGLGKREAFPIDVWMKRIMEELYFDSEKQSMPVLSELAKEKFGEYGGYAQQYLFAYARENGNNKNNG